MAKLPQSPNLSNCSRKELLDYFIASWQLEETLLQSVKEAETFYLSPDPLRNRLVFYLGHSAVFYINKLIRVGLLDRRINDYYEHLFEIGVDPETPAELDLAVRDIRWPDVAKVWQYRQDVREVVSKVITHNSLDLPITKDSPWWALLMSIEHSLIHFETSSMLLRQLPPSKLQRPRSWCYAESQGATLENKMLSVTGGSVRLGKAIDSSTYGWDSDYGSLAVNVKPFAASQYLISNGEFLEFVRDGGYDCPTYWDEASWQWKQRNNVRQPKFWLSVEDGYKYRTVFEEISLPLDFPVEVNHYEALAFCRWRGEGYRLLTEAEWNLALGDDLQQQSEDLSSHNLNLKYCSPSPVGLSDRSNNQFGFADLRGNVWEWLGDIFQDLPGFHVHNLYPDYSAPFCDRKHYLMKGGSWASMGAYGAVDCRNWFRPYFYQHVGFRVARDFD